MPEFCEICSVELTWEDGDVLCAQCTEDEAKIRAIEEGVTPKGTDH